MVIKSIIVLGIELIIFYIFGTAFGLFLKQKGKLSIGLRIMEGFFVYEILFQIVAMPFILIRGRLSTLTWCWNLLLAVLLLLMGWYIKDVVPQDAKNLVKKTKELKGTAVIAFLMVMAVCWYVSVNGERNEDARYYIGLVNTTLTHDYLFRYNVYTGELAVSLYLRRMLATFEIQAAALCKTFAIHPLVFMRVERACLNVILTAISVFLLGKLWFAKREETEKNKKSCMLVCATFLLYGVSAGTIYTNAAFLLYRAYEAKAFTGNAVIYFILFLAASYRQSKQKLYLLLLFFALWGSLALSTSAFMVAAAGAAVILTAHAASCIYQKKAKA